MRKFATYFANRLREPTTWAAIVLTLQEAGVAFSPENVELLLGMELDTMIRTVGISLAATVAVFMKEGRADD